MQNKLLPWIQVIAHREEKIQCASKKDEFCWDNHNVRDLTEDFDGFPYKETSIWNLQQTKFFDIALGGNVKELRIVNEDGQIAWAEKLIEEVFYIPEEFLEEDPQTSGLKQMISID